MLELGEGKPIISIIAGIHGNETSSLLVLDKLIGRLRHLSGTVRIIFSANPPAAAEWRRMNSVDSLDMNRLFPGDKNKTITHRLAASLVEAVSDSDAVVDLHAFEMETPLMGILIAGNENKALIEAFSPKQAWVINSERNEERQFGRALSPVLSELGIPNIAVEMNSPQRIEETQVDECVDGILRVLSSHGMIDEKCTRRPFRFFERTVVENPDEGIFVPSVSVFDTVEKGDVIGVLRKLPEFEEQRITASCKGTVMQLLHKCFVCPGAELAAIGREASP